ncbi:thioredoxin domain-containing protein 11 [Copidosoma floridanum]|uniref:thioredoxin domain-containing protein 11 n=1 Tax=Copidosoma floridanum TaxID=29053 RepID=UPI0006C99794|nr:thioredoxin domain-containing protein 11 [Copidosoma floridanum]XP_014215525.1 thioredoxin domain-containing protein 11 [Copidosoma floridanum]
MTIKENCKSEEPVDRPSRNEEKSEHTEKAVAKNKNKNCKVKSTLERKLSSKMLTYARETICFFLAVIFTALAAMHSSPPRVSKPPIARPFFNESSVVLDYYKGHLNALIERVTDSDFSFVLYYAPWDAESQAIKKEFESVARYYHSQVFFAAINCWHPGSECRARYSKIQSYPVLMFYPSKESGVQYRGIRTAPYMILFIHNFLNPIKRVSSDNELMDLLRSHDAVMIGYFRFWGLRSTPGYKQFYQAALQTLEKYPNGELAYVMITNSHTASDHGVEQFPAASLLMWNETLFYPDGNAWTADNLSGWVNKVVHRVVTWLQPPGSKSFTFAPYLWGGPMLFLFTPRNPLHSENHYYNLLREVALEYYDCSDSPQIQNLIQRLRKSRLEAPLIAYKKREWCTNLFEEETANKSLLTAKNKNRWSNNTANCCSDIPTNKCVSCSKRSSEDLDKMCAAPGSACRGSDVFSLPTFAFGEDQNFGYIENRKTDSHEGRCFAERCRDDTTTEKEIDPYSSIAVQRTALKEDCRRFLSGYSYQRPIFPQNSDFNSGSDEIPLTDAICKVNKTLAIVAIDSLHYLHFAEGLGIDISRSPDKTAAVIMDPADESQFVMQEEFGKNTLVQFINNYTNGYLSRTLRSNNPKRFVRSFINKSECRKSVESRICVQELSTENFSDTVLNSDKDVVVMYHSPYCAFCSAVAYVYLTVAQYLSKMDHLEFVRIDGDNNDLPWEYTMNRYPSILFFPARRKEDSTLFPWTLPVSVGNLLSFVLANLDEESHVEALVNLCAISAGGSPVDCLDRARWLCLDVLEEYLKKLRRLRRFHWLSKPEKRFLNRHRRELMLKLQLIKEVHILLGSSNNLAKDKTKVQMLRNVFKKFYKTLATLRQNKGKNEYFESEGELVKQNTL